MTASRPKVLVAMSGGVDSSVAAALLLRQGYDVVGCFMRLGSPGETFDELEPFDSAGVACDPKNIRIGKQGCCSINDAADARAVAAQLDIPFYVCNFKKDFGRIIDYFVGEYNAGRTPNPCVRCNDWLKFGKLHDYARQIDAQYVASGHYARVGRSDDTAPGRAGHDPNWALKRGVDHDKDQSYVLFGAPRERLAEMLLPIGGYRKDQVRAIARELGLPVFNKPDSQEICFVPDNDYAGLVKRRSPDAVSAGQIVDSSGKVLGEHDGHQHFTIGQRRGIGVALGYPLYVVHKDPASNTVTVGERDDLKSVGCTASEMNWLVDLWGVQATGPNEPTDWVTCTAQIRYNAEPVPARVRLIDDDAFDVQFDEPQFAVAPGQAVVCYDGDLVLGGGWMTEAHPSHADDAAPAPPQESRQ
jgi:tRNA-uridine 2-sulfurtransferase